MPNKILFFSLAILVVGSALFFGRSFLNGSVFAKNKIVRVQIKGTVLQTEVAQTEFQREKGLSGRSVMAMDSAMLFIYPKPVTPVFWMKDMRFPIDMIFISDGKIVDMAKDMQPPMPERPLQTHVSPVPINWVLEVNAGLCDRKGWKIGDQVKLVP